MFYCYFPFLLLRSFRSLVIWLISIGYSLTNKRFLTILGYFGVFWRFLTQFSKLTENNQIIFSGKLVNSYIFRLRLIRAFFDVPFAQNKFLTEVTLAISGVQFSFDTLFQYLNFVRFSSYSKLWLSYRCSL